MIQNDKPSISSGTACFLIQDDSLYEKYHAPFFTWLKDSGYTLWPGSRGYSEHVNWVYVNLTSKMFCPGIPGIPVTRAVADHAITIEEFQQIHAIFAKYAGLAPLQMSEALPRSEAELAEQQKKREEVLAELDAYWDGMTLEKYWKMVRSDLKTRLDFLRPKELDAYLEEKADYANEAFARKCQADDTAFWLWQMW